MTAIDLARLRALADPDRVRECLEGAWRACAAGLPLAAIPWIREALAEYDRVVEPR